MLASCELWKENWCVFQGVLPPWLAVFLGEGPFSKIEGLPSPSILARAPHWGAFNVGKSFPCQQQQSPRFSHSPAPRFWQGPLNFGKVTVPPKNSQFGRRKKIFVDSRKFSLGNGCAMCFLQQQKMKKSVKFGLSNRSNIALPRIGGTTLYPVSASY